jgi:hypothetical protein
MKAEVVKMGRKQLLKKIEKNKISPMVAYRKLYMKQKVQYASFCKINIRLNNESKNLNYFMRALFLFPLPVFVLQIGIGFARKHIENIDISELRKMIAHMKNTSVVVQDANKEVNINIKFY